MTTLLMIGTRKGLFVARSDDRVTWAVEGPAFAMNAVYAVAIDTRRATPRLLAGADSEHWGPSVFHSDDLGSTWTETEGGALRFPESTGAALARAWQLQPAGATEPDVVYAGVEPAALFRSDDGGATFSLVEGLWDHPHRPRWQPGGGGLCLHTVVPHPTDSDRMVVAVSAAGVYRTGDGGKSWEASNSGITAWHNPDPHPTFGQCVHKIARHPDRPDEMFLQNHGGVYRSRDGGATWGEIHEGLPATFGFPLVAHPHRPGTAYVYPLVADMHRMPPDDACRIYRTTDAGDSWHPLSAGLPQQDAYITVLRDALCTDDADPAGVYFGTRTGDVFASADEGETWSSLARYLPDVLTVRAAQVG
jgi:photosystem II stability/assembly factor-like uncharacterized protein